MSVPDGWVAFDDFMSLNVVRELTHFKSPRSHLFLVRLVTQVEKINNELRNIHYQKD